MKKTNMLLGLALFMALVGRGGAQTSTAPVLDLEMRRVECATDFSGWRFLVKNLGTQPIVLSDLEVHLWVHGAEPIQSQSWTAGSLTTPQGVWSVQGVTVVTSPMNRFMAYPLDQLADWEVAVKNTDASALPPGGVWQDSYFSYHYSGWDNMEPEMDYSKAPECGDGTVYFENPTVGLYYRGNLVAEWIDGQDIDPQSGKDPRPPLDVTGVESETSPISSPWNGEQVCGLVQIAVRPSVPQWKIQWSVSGKDQWNDLSSQNQGAFWSTDWDTRALPAGAYDLQFLDSQKQAAVEKISVQVGTPAFSQSLILPNGGIPAGLAISQNNLFVLDQKNQTVQEWGPVEGWQGNEGQYGNRLGEMDQAVNLAVDPAGVIYVADDGNNRVESLDPDGDSVLGNQILLAPTDVKTAASGIYALDGGTLHRFGFNGQYLYSGRLQGGTSYAGMAVDDAGLVYALNGLTHVVEVYDPGFDPVTTWTGLSQDWTPTSLVYAQGRLWITDSVHDLVIKLGLDGNPLAVFGGYGSGGAQFDQPYCAIPDGQGNLFVSDTGNARVEKFALSAGAIPTTPTPIVLALSGFTADPNPFDPEFSSTDISYQLSEAASVHLAIQSPSGQVVYQQDYPAGNFGGQSGRNQLGWDALSQGTALPDGTYQATLTAQAQGQQVQAQLLLVLSSTGAATPQTPTPAATGTPTAGVTPFETPTDTPEPGATWTATPVVTETATVVSPTDTNTPADTATQTPVIAVPTDTDTVVPPTATDTPDDTITQTPVMFAPTDTATVPPATATNTAVTPSLTPTAVPPSATPTFTLVAPLPTNTPTMALPTFTNTVPAPTNTYTPVPATNTDTPVPVPPTATPTANGCARVDVEPFLNCVEDQGSQVIAHFGYQNNSMKDCYNPTAVTIPVGADNALSYGNGQQPTEFVPGRDGDAFRITFPYNVTVSWTLDGHTVSASINSPLCAGSIPLPTPTPHH